MKGKLSATAALTVVALALAVPAAPAQSGPPRDWFERAADAAVHDAVAPDWFERAAISAQNDAVVVSRPDSHDLVTPVASGYLDAADRAQRIDVVVPTASSDAHERSAPPSGELTRSTTSVASSGTDLELPQIGIGFGIGLLLALGLVALLRFRPNRPLAQ
jgi:hypothetical protein